MTAPFTLHDRVEAVTRDGSRIVWTPGEVIGRTLEAPEATLDAKGFHRVKTAALDILAGWLGVTVEQLAESGRTAA